MSLTFDEPVPYDFALFFNAVVIPRPFEDEYALRTATAEASARSTAGPDVTLAADWLNDTTAKLGTGPQPHLVTEAR